MLFVSANEKRLQNQVYRQKKEIELLPKKLDKPLTTSNKLKADLWIALT